MNTTYRVRIDREARQLDLALAIDVQARTSKLPPVVESHASGAASLSLAVPTWVPGAYAFMRYGRAVFDLTAVDTATGKSLVVERAGFSGFEIANPPANVTVRAKIAASDVAWSELVGFVEPDVAIVHAAHFPFVPAHEGPCRVTFELPSGWALHHPGGAKRISDDTFEHPSFASLLDTPVVAGKFDCIERKLGDTTFRHLFVRRAVGYEAEVDRFVDDVMKVTARAVEVFGFAPFADYTFIYTTDPRAHWGLEHAHATLMGVGDAVFFDEEERRAAIRLAAHELFHAWNVCRLKPRAFVKPDLVNGSFPDGLWISEGFTRYYELLLATRMGSLTPARFLSNLVRYDDALRARPASKHTSLVDSSRATFLNHTRYPGAANATIDYYDKGMVVAFALDACLRTAKKPSSLDALLGGFYEAFVGRGFTTEEAIDWFDARAAALGTKEPVGTLLRRIVVGAAMPDTAAWLEALGAVVERGTAPHLGLWLENAKGPTITDVAEQSPAAAAGLGAGDVILAQEGFTFRPDAIKWLVRRGEPFTVQVRTGHIAREARVTPAPRATVMSLSLPRGGADLASWLGDAARDLAPGANVPLGFFDNFHVRDAFL